MRNFRLFYIIFFFLLLTFILSIVFGFIILFANNNDLSLPSLFSQAGNTFLYLSGYEDLENTGIFLKIFLALLGTTMISILSAYITVYFLTRTNVELDNNLYVYQNDKNTNNYDCYFLLENKGDDICEVKVSFCLVNKKDNTTIQNYLIDRSRIIMLKRSDWKLNFQINPIECPLIFKALSEFYADTPTSELLKIYVIFSFIDDKTNSSSTHVRHFSKDNINFKDKEISTQFKKFMTNPYYLLPTEDFNPINSDFIELTKKDSNLEISLNKDYFNQHKDILENEENPFTMACSSYYPNLDWRYFYENNWKLEISYESNITTSEFLTLELKDSTISQPVITEDIPIEEGEHNYSIKLTSSKYSLEAFETIRELDFTIFLKKINKSNENTKIRIKEIRLVKN